MSALTRSDVIGLARIEIEVRDSAPFARFSLKGNGIVEVTSGPALVGSECVVGRWQIVGGRPEKVS